MDTLALIDHSDGTGLSRAYDVLRGGNEGLLVAFLGDLDEEQAAVVAKMRQRSGGAVAFVLDPGTWTREATDVPPAGGTHEKRLRMLRESGWTAIGVERGASLDELWRQADQERSSLAALSGEARG
jgi:hypothetical protein